MSKRVQFKIACAFLLAWSLVLALIAPEQHFRDLRASQIKTAHLVPSVDRDLRLPINPKTIAEITHLHVALDEAPNAGHLEDVIDRLPSFKQWRVLAQSAQYSYAEQVTQLERADSADESARRILELLTHPIFPTDDTWATFEDLLDFHRIAPPQEGAIIQAGLARMASEGPLTRVAHWYARLLEWEAQACTSATTPTLIHDPSRQSALCDRTPDLSNELEAFLVAANLRQASDWRTEIQAIVRRCAQQTEDLVADALVGEGRWTEAGWDWYGWHVEYNQALAVVRKQGSGVTKAVGPGAQNQYPLAPAEQELVQCIERTTGSSTVSAPLHQELDLVLTREVPAIPAQAQLTDIGRGQFH